MGNVDGSVGGPVTFLAFVLAVLAFGYAGRKESLKLILATGLTMIGTAVAVIVVTALIVVTGA